MYIFDLDNSIFFILHLYIKILNVIDTVTADQHLYIFLTYWGEPVIPVIFYRHFRQICHDNNVNDGKTNKYSLRILHIPLYVSKNKERWCGFHHMWYLCIKPFKYKSFSYFLYFNVKLKIEKTLSANTVLSSHTKRTNKQNI